MKTENMMHCNSMTLPNTLWEVRNLESVGTVPAEYLKKKDELRPGRVSGATSETGMAEAYQPGDLPPASGPVSDGYDGNDKNGDSPDHRSRGTRHGEDDGELPAWKRKRPPFAVLQPEWIELSPYGDFPHPRGIQRVDRMAAEKIVNTFNSFWAKLGRKFAGLPIFIGHPDVPELAKEYPDRKAYGWIVEMQARPQGLYGLAKWSDAGRELVANAHYKFYSPFWEAEPIGTEGGKSVYRPVALISVGLTNSPNIPVLPLANESDSGHEARSFTEGNKGNEGRRGNGSPQKNVTVVAGQAENTDRYGFRSEENNFTGENRVMKENGLTEGNEVNENMAARYPNPGFSNSAGGTPAGTGGTPVLPMMPLANEVLALQTLLMQRDERIHGMHQTMENARRGWGEKVAQMEQEIGTLRSAVERLEQSRIDVALEHALTQGRIAPAERGLWNSRLRSDFELKYEELKGRAPVVHMSSVTMDLRGKNGVELMNEETRSKVIKELMAVKMRFGMKYPDAWQALKEERPDLFAAMKHPESAF